MARWRCPVPDASTAPDTWTPLVVMAATVLGEAESETLVGKRAVACVIVNRARDKRWPDDEGEVCLQKLQFSCWNIGSPRIPTMFRPQAHVSEALWNDCFRVALEAMFGLGPDPTNGATHYLNPVETRRIRGGTMPSWYVPAKITATIGAHEFLRL